MGERGRTLKRVVRRVAGVRGATIALTLLMFGTVPGAPPRRLAFERSILPLPPAPDHDVELTVRTWSEPGHTRLPRARVRVLAMIDGRAFLAGSGETDANGELTLRRLPRTAAWILADADGRARASSQRVLTAPDLPVDLGLSAGQTLGVVVTDDLGQPLPDAEIEITGGDPLPIGARTDVDGRGTATRLRDGPWTVAVHAAGFESVVRHGVNEGEVPRVVLRKLGAFVVHVVGEDGNPTPLARVQIAGSALWPARMTDTGVDGTARIGGLGTGSYAFRASAGPLVSQTDLGVTLARGEEQQVTLKLVRGVFITARVTDGDAEDAEPIERARVTLVEGGLSPFPFESLSDATGSVRFGPVLPGPALLRAQADGYVPRGGVAMPEDGRLATIVMVRAGTLEGRVVDASGRPVGGASVAVVGSSFSGEPIQDDPGTQSFRQAEFDANLGGARPLVPSGELGVVPGPVPKIPHAFGLPSAIPLPAGAATLGEPWVTKEDGTFRITPVSPGRVRVVVHHPEFLEALSDAVTLTSDGEAHVDVVVHTGGTLEGRVVDASGRAVVGANVSVAALRGSTERSTRSATDGTFAFAAVPEGVVVTASPEDEADLRIARATVSVAEGGRATVSLTLPDARPPLDVRVRDDRGYPIGAAQVSAGSVDPSTPLRTTAFSDTEGLAQIPGARGVPLRLSVSAPGHASTSVDVAATELAAEVTLATAETVTGIVREPRTGIPIVGAEVLLYASDGVHRSGTDATGGFKLRDVAPGPARIRIRAGERVTVDLSVEVRATTARTQELDAIELASEAVVEGTVVDAHGDVVPGARVGKDHVATYVLARGHDASVATTDAKGRFRLGGLNEGQVALEAYAPGVGRGRLEQVETTAGRPVRHLTIQLAAEPGGGSSEPTSTGGVAVTLGEASGETPDVVVVAVAEGSEAERAGLAAGDAIVAIDGVAVRTIVDARARLSGPIGDDVIVTRRRDDKVESLRVPRDAVRR